MNRVILSGVLISVREVNETPFYECKIRCGNTCITFYTFKNFCGYVGRHIDAEGFIGHDNMILISDVHTDYENTNYEYGV